MATLYYYTRVLASTVLHIGYEEVEVTVVLAFSTFTTSTSKLNVEPARGWFASIRTCSSSTCTNKKKRHLKYS